MNERCSTEITLILGSAAQRASRKFSTADSSITASSGGRAGPEVQQQPNFGAPAQRERGKGAESANGAWRGRSSAQVFGGSSRDSSESSQRAAAAEAKRSRFADNSTTPEPAFRFAAVAPVSPRHRPRALPQTSAAATAKPAIVTSAAGVEWANQDAQLSQQRQRADKREERGPETFQREGDRRE